MSFPRINRQTIVGLFFFALIVSGSLAYSKSIELRADRLTFFSVGQGDATLFETVGGERILIDGGPDESAEKKLSQKLPWWDHRLSAVVITHSHSDHIQGLEKILKNFRVENLYMAKNIEVTPFLENLTAIARNKGTNVRLLTADYQLNMADGANLKLLVDMSPLASNEQCIVSLLSDAGATAIILADVGEEQEKRLITKLKDFKADIIRIGHHGSDFGTSEAILEKWQPRQAVISVGRNNSFGHPSHRVLKRLERKGIAISRTDEGGDVAYALKNNHWELAP